jgi:antitoxin CcdA
MRQAPASGAFVGRLQNRNPVKPMCLECTILMRVRMRYSLLIIHLPRCRRMARRGSKTMVKRDTNVSIRSDFLAAAHDAGINLSVALERALTQELASVKREKWRTANREAVAAYNEHVEKHGTFSDDVRGF